MELELTNIQQMNLNFIVERLPSNSTQTGLELMT